MERVKPILFSGPMIRALLDGRKTQTRRILKPQPLSGWAAAERHYLPDKRLWRLRDGTSGSCEEVKIAYAPGDILWVREAITRFDKGTCDQHVWYRAGRNENWGARDGFKYWDLAGGPDVEWPKDVPGPGGGAAYNVPSTHMPRWASRITLEVTDVRVQQLQDISRNDAIVEGIEPVDEFPAGNQRWRDYLGFRSGCSSPILSFSTLWDSINAGRGFPYSANPWVIAITFSVHRQNVDALLAARDAA